MHVNVYSCVQQERERKKGREKRKEKRALMLLPPPQYRKKFNAGEYAIPTQHTAVGLLKVSTVAHLWLFIVDSCNALGCMMCVCVCVCVCASSVLKTLRTRPG